MIIFEEISPRHKWIIKWYLFRNKDIYFIRLNRITKSKKWIKELVSKKYIKDINLKFKLNTFDGFYYDSAFNNVDSFFQILDRNEILKKFRQLYKSDKIQLTFKKVLNAKLARFYYLNYILNKIQNRYFDENIFFIPPNGIELYRTDGCEIYDYFKFYKLAKSINANLFNTANIRFPIWAIAISYIKTFKRGIYTRLKILFFLFWIFLRKTISLFTFKKSILKKYYKYAIVLMSSARQLTNKIQSVDFLIDGNLIKKEETLFISPYKKLDTKSRIYFEKNKLYYLDNCDIFISMKNIKEILSIYLSLLLSFWKEDDILLKTGLKLIYHYLRWKSFTENVRIKNLITHCDFVIQSISRNIILRQQNCKTYYYVDSVNFGCFFSKQKSIAEGRHNNLGFLYYDYFISWCDKASNNFRISHSDFKEYINVGCLWAEHLREIATGKIKSDFRDKLFKKGYNQKMKLVSVFDSTFHDDSITTYEDGIKFLQGILKLLEDSPDIFIVLKEKKTRNFHKNMTNRFEDILTSYIELEKHPRCYSIAKWENSSEIIAFSDLTISFPFTSTTFEALAARRKAVWYDAANKVRDTFYDEIPGLICHDYEELLDRVENLLWKISNKDYEKYLNTYIKGNVESYLDGKAISRFRRLLNNQR